MARNNFSKFCAAAGMAVVSENNRSDSAEQGRAYNWLLVMPRITLFDDQQYNFPIGIAYVSAALKATGRRVFTLNLNYKKGADDAILARVIEENNIGIIGCGGISIQYPLLNEIFDAAKRIKPGIITVAGGGIITSAPVVAMQALRNVDYGIIGEGEITVCRLAAAFESGGNNFSEVKGLVYKDRDGRFVTTPPRPEIDDLDMIPWPDYEGFEYGEMLSKTPLDILTGSKKNERIGIVFYSRSCPYNCTFCFHSSGKKYRTRSLDSFFEEFDWLMARYAFNSFYLADEFFIRNLEFVKAFCARIKKYRVSWTCSGRVDNITREILKELKASGCDNIGLGVESGNDHILKSMRKHITRAQIENAYSMCQAEGVAVIGNLIFGDLEETTETAMDTIAWWKKHQDWALTMHWIIAYPGTHIYNVAVERGVIKDPVQFLKDGCPEVNFSKMTDAERRQIASAIDMLVNDQHDFLTGAALSPGQTGKVSVTGRCPYCGAAKTFLNLDPIRPVKLEICDTCSHTLRLYAYDYIDMSVFTENVNEILATQKMAVWPVVVGLAKLIELAPVLKSKDIYLIDSSAFKQGIEISTQRIHPPEILNEENISTVYISTSTSISTDIMTRIKKDFPLVARVEPVGNLFFKKK